MQAESSKKNQTSSAMRGLARIPDTVWVACGGVLGALARNGVDELFLPSQVLHPGFPWPTFLINVSGSAMLGFLLAWADESENPPCWLKPFAAVGFCGAYTTFSTVSVEILLLARDGQPALAMTYLASSLLCAILVVTLTTAIAVRIFKKADSAPRRAEA